jgi:hypothetical protein
MLSELEEIITYKQHADQPDRQATQRKTWMKRYISRIEHIPARVSDKSSGDLGSRDANLMSKSGSESSKLGRWF